MNLEKQNLLLSYLISSQELFIKVAPILKTAYFDPKLKSTISFVKTYFDTYKSPPTSDQVHAETGTSVNCRSFTKQEIVYAEAELETFCRNKAVEHAILAAPKLLVDGNHDEILSLMRDAITVAISRNVGLDYFNDPEARLQMLAMNQNMIPTNWFKLDENLGGGINRKEMIIFAAPPGVGKSLTMSNLARNLLKQGLNGVYITLELSEEVVAKRFDSMFSAIPQVEILQNITKTSIEIRKQAEHHGTMRIKRMPESSTNANHIRAYLKEFEIVYGYIPDFLVVDYLDLMTSCQQISAENTFVRDKFISEELRAIANEYNLAMITASQMNRSALTTDIEDVGQANIAGGISKINTADNVVLIIQTPQMKAKGEMQFKLLKTRSSGGVGNIYMLRFDPGSLRLENLEEGSSKVNRSLSTFIGNKKKSAELLSSDEKKKPATLPPTLPFQV